jgi:kynureninase
MTEIAAAVSAMGPGPLQDDDLRRQIDPLFSRVLRQTKGLIYLANHSLGRPLDRTISDVAEGLFHWYSDLDAAWDSWRSEMLSFRSHVASIIQAPGPHCIVPKANAGQGLRAVLNRYDRTIRVVTTLNEFHSIDHILRAYHLRNRVHVDWIKPGNGRRYCFDDFAQALGTGADLLVASMVFFDTGQFMSEFSNVVALAHSRGATVLADLYHVAGAVPVDVVSLGVDFAVGGSYKYLRGGPGAAWLYVHPRLLGETPRTLDTGWFAAAHPFEFRRPEHLRFAQGAEGWLESTPAVLPFYQARAGLEFSLAMGVERLRAYSLDQQAFLTSRLLELGVFTLAPDMPRGAFIAIPTPNAAAALKALRIVGVVADSRGDLLRLCPDILNSTDELAEGAERVARALLALR